MRRKSFSPLNYRNEKQRNCAAAIFLNDAMWHLCEKSGQDEMRLFCDDYADYEAFHILHALATLAVYAPAKNRAQFPAPAKNRAHSLHRTPPDTVTKK